MPNIQADGLVAFGVTPVYADQDQVRGARRICIDERKTVPNACNVDPGGEGLQHLRQTLRNAGPIITDQDRCQRATVGHQTYLGEQGAGARRGRGVVLMHHAVIPLLSQVKGVGRMQLPMRKTTTGGLAMELTAVPSWVTTGN